MKKACLLAFLFLSATSFAQNFEEGQDNRDIMKNELSLNVFNVLAFGVLDASYERVLNDNGSISLELFSNVLRLSKGEDQDLSEVYTKNFSLTTKYKYFFSETKTAWGFYTEVFAMLSTGDNEEQIDYISPDGYVEYRYEEVDYTDFALGVGVGYKYVAKQGFLIDLSFGLGRNLFHKDSPIIVSLPSISFGYRF